MPQSPTKPVYVLHGQDDYLRRQRRAELTRRLTDRLQANLAVVNFDASAELADVLDELRTAPLLAARRIVILRDADKFIAEHAESFEKYLAAPPGTGVLIVITDSWPPKSPKGEAGADSRKAVKSLDRIVRKVGELIDCSAPSASSLPRWLASAAEAGGKRIAPQAARLLVEWIGPDLSRLDSEIRKLAIYVGSRSEITVEDVSAVAVATAGVEPFALTNAIGRRDTRKALTILAAMLTRRGEEIRTLGMLAWHVRKTLAAAGRNAAAAEKARRDTRKLLATDLAMKTGADPLTAMQVLVMGLTGIRD